MYIQFIFKPRLLKLSIAIYSNSYILLLNDYVELLILSLILLFKLHGQILLPTSYLHLMLCHIIKVHLNDRQSQIDIDLWYVHLYFFN